MSPIARQRRRRAGPSTCNPRDIARTCRSPAKALARTSTPAWVSRRAALAAQWAHCPTRPATRWRSCGWGRTSQRRAAGVRGNEQEPAQICETLARGSIGSDSGPLARKHSPVFKGTESAARTVCAAFTTNMYVLLQRKQCPKLFEIKSQMQYSAARICDVALSLSGQVCSRGRMIISRVRRTTNTS